MASPGPSARSCTVRGGSFDFIAHADATTVEWTYVYLPSSPLHAPLVGTVIGVFWRRPMVRALAIALGTVAPRAAQAPGASASETAA